MWLSDIGFDGDAVVATLLNSPNQLSSVAEGDQVSLVLEEIEDWMYVVEGRVYGAFTVQVMRSQMSVDERAEHDEAWGLEFPEPSRVDLVPKWAEGGESQDPDVEHPMSENMADGLAEAVAADPESFFRTGPSGLNTLHSLALGGSQACVRVLLDKGADPRVRTQSGRTARELAAMLGWPRVVELLRSVEEAD
jgi:hypothetical protein